VRVAGSVHISQSHEELFIRSEMPTARNILCRNGRAILSGFKPAKVPAQAGAGIPEFKIDHSPATRGYGCGRRRMPTGFCAL